MALNQLFSVLFVNVRIDNKAMHSHVNMSKYEGNMHGVQCRPSAVVECSGFGNLETTHFMFTAVNPVFTPFALTNRSVDCAIDRYT